MQYIILISFIVLKVNSEKWYVASGEEEQKFEDVNDEYGEVSRTIYTPNKLWRYRYNNTKPIESISEKHLVKRIDTVPHELNAEDTNKESHDNDNSNEFSIQLPEILSSPDKPIDPHDLSDQNQNHQQYTTKAQSYITYDKTIHNVNVFRRSFPRRKVIRRRCRPFRKSKMLKHNQKAKTKFLEVFEVVQFQHESCSSSSGLEGKCLHEFDCQTSGGTAMGTCADGYGTCCVSQFTCGSKTNMVSSWFVNPGFPSPSSERLSCTFTIDKASEDIVQMRLDFSNFELLPPTDGSCDQDQFTVLGHNMNGNMPILCGINTGHHVYIGVNDVAGPVELTFQTVTEDARLFSIKVTQLSSSDELAAPKGCLQYHTGINGHLESFNYRDQSDIVIARSPGYMNNLNYAMCIQRTPQSCSVTYTNAGDMEIRNYDLDGLPIIPLGQAGVEIFNCPSDWLLMAAARLCGDRLNDGSIIQDFALDAPVVDSGAGPLVVWFRSDGGYIGRGFKIHYLQNPCTSTI